MDKVFETYSERYGANLSLTDEYIISYDTSTILDLYRLSDKSRNEVLALIEKIGSKIDHFVSYYVAFEVARNKERAKKDLDEKITDIRSKFNSFKKSLSGISRAGGYSTPFEDLSRALNVQLNDIQESIDRKARTIRQSESGVSSLFDSVSDIFTGKVTGQLERRDVERIVASGKERYSAQIPPGFSDNSKSEYVNFFGIPVESKYGDLIIWEDLIAHCQCEKKNLIFITSDQKPDWVEYRSIRPDLAAEFHRRTGFFIYVYTLSEFERKFSDYLGLKLSENSKIELEEIEREYENWLDEVVSAFEGLGGDVALRELYDYIERNTNRKLSDNWTSTVRRTIYYHSSDVEAFQGKLDIFERVGSGRTGKWKLR